MIQSIAYKRHSCKFQVFSSFNFLRMEMHFNVHSFLFLNGILMTSASLLYKIHKTNGKKTFFLIQPFPCGWKISITFIYIIHMDEYMTKIHDTIYLSIKIYLEILSINYIEYFLRIQKSYLFLIQIHSPSLHHKM